MFSHTTIRHSYDFSQHMVEMAVEASQPPSEDALREREQTDRQDNMIIKFLRTLRETLYRN